MRYRAEVLRDLAGGRRLEQIDELAELVRRRGAEAALKPASINRYLAILKRVATLAYRWRWTDLPLAPHIELLPGEARRTVYATPHDLRRLIAAADARDLLGHADIKTTGIYLATARRDLHAAVGRLPDVLGEGRGKKKRPAGRKRAA